jgi:proline iminopeptidase
MKYLFALLLFLHGAVHAAPVTEGDVRSGPATLHYWEQGTGAPVLLLSGGPGFASYLHPVMAELSRNHRVIMMDQRGTGHSPVAPLDATTISTGALINDLEVLRQHLHIAHWTVLGHSWGGMLAMRYGIARPEATDALVLVGSGGMNSDFYKYFSSNVRYRLLPSDLAVEAYWQEPERKRADPARARIEAMRAVLPGYFYDRKNSVAFSQALAPADLNGSMQSLIFREIATQDLGPGMAAFNKPVLVLMGRQDPVGESVQYAIRDACRTARLAFIEKSGHFPWIEQPAAFYTAVDGFLGALL